MKNHAAIATIPPATSPARPLSPEERAREFFDDVVRRGVDPLRQDVGDVQAMLHAIYPAAARMNEPLPTEATLERYLQFARPRQSPKGFDNNANYLRNFFARVRVADLRQLTASMVEEFLDRRVEEEGIAPKTYNRIREVLHTLFAYLQRLDLVIHNPIAKVRRMTEPRRVIRYLTLEDVERLLCVLKQDEHLEPIIAFLVFSGCRRGEAVWLQWCDVDLERDLIQIRAKAGWTPKTKRDRVVPISKRLKPYLVKHRAQRRPSSVWAFTSREHHQLNGDNLTHAFSSLMWENGLPWNLLDLRHTFASLLVQRGMSLEKVAALMGNSPTICLRHYARLRPESMHEEADF